MTTASATPTQMPESIPAECADAHRIVAFTFQAAFADWPLRFGLIELRRLRDEVARSISTPLASFCTKNGNMADYVGKTLYGKTGKKPRKNRNLPHVAT